MERPEIIEMDSRGITFHMEAGDLLLKFDEVEMFLIYPERCSTCNHLLIFHPKKSEEKCIIGSCPCLIPTITNDTQNSSQLDDPLWWRKHNLSSERSPDKASAFFSGMS